MKKCFSFLLLITLSFTLQSQNLLPERWRFQTGDNPAWAEQGFDDSAWPEIRAGLSWEKQGYFGYDGYAWYRATFYIPSKYREVAEKYGGLTLVLGKIDDVDFTYFNGDLVGNMGSLPPKYVTMYNVDRVYRIPAKKVLWDQPNTIAIRVFDLYGDGGPYSYPVQLSVRGLNDKLTIGPAFQEPDCILLNHAIVELPVMFNNRSSRELTGTVTVKVLSDFGAEVASITKEVALPGKEETVISLPVEGIGPGFYKATVSFSGELALKSMIYGFGYEPEKIVSPTDRQPDFEAFWDKARMDLDAVDPQFKLIRVDSLCTSRREVYLVEMRSLGNALIRGWYSVPAKPGKYPAVMQVPGYTGNEQPEYVDYGDDIIGFALNIRGHGNSQDDINPGFPGFLLSGLEDKETYIYRGAYMDCVRGIEFLFSRPEVDTTRVGVEGGSQGGALTFATAALCTHRIRACVPQVPFLSDFRDYFKVAPWPANEFLENARQQMNLTDEEIYLTLSYFDIKNLAPWITAPLLMGVGLVDDVCPPHINFAAYNQVTSEKHYIVYPQSGHGLPLEFLDKRMEFLREKMK